MFLLYLLTHLASIEKKLHFQLQQTDTKEREKDMQKGRGGRKSQGMMGNLSRDEMKEKYINKLRGETIGN